MHSRGPLVFRIDEKLLQRRPPRLTFAATLKALCKQVKAGDLEANFVVDILNENRLLPYMIGHSKSLIDISLGRNTNASKIGDLIVSEECIRGTYELCISFLEFVLAIICQPDFKDTTRTILASLTYILNEIYPSHHIWTYRNIHDMNKILCLCTEIFHHIVVNIREPFDYNNYSELEIVTLIDLSQHQAHKQLLDVIIAGKSCIKKKIEELNLSTEHGLRDTPIVINVRQSLFMFNKLLIHSKFLKNHCDQEKQSPSDSSPTGHGASSSIAPVTNIERALFDTSIRPGLLQHLFSYIYEEVDSSTACLAVDLIKNIAKKFSMSLMASLGSEADKVCEFFVNCLDDKVANVDLKFAILGLLSTCVKHQPGLIELFLDFKREPKGDATKTKDSAETDSLSSLEVVMNLLNSCKVRKEDTQKQLHTYVMKFILTFWQKHHSAIEQFDKAKEFWDSITYPLFKFLESEKEKDSESTNTTTNNSTQALNDKLNSYTLMILAREIFCLNAGISERKMNPSLESILDDLSKKNLLSKYSSSIKNKYSNIPTSLNSKKDNDRILAAWRDFLTSFAKYKPFEISDEVQNQIIENILHCLMIELRQDEKLSKERINSCGETLLIVWTKWAPKNQRGLDVFNSIHELLYLADSSKEHLPFSFLLTFQSTLNLYLTRHRDYLLKSKRSFDFLVPAVQLMQFSLKVVEEYLNKQLRSAEFNYKPGVESRLCLLSVMTLRFIIDVSRYDVSLWISYIQANLKTNSLVDFLSLLINRRAGSEICFAIVELLLCLSSIKETADHLNRSALINEVNMIVISSYERPYTHLSQLASISSNITNAQLEDNGVDQIQPKSTTVPMDVTISSTPMSDTTKIFLDNMNSDHKWLPIFWHVIRLNISMMLTLSSDYVSTAVEFLSIHCIRICEILELLRTKPRTINMEEALLMIHMINLVLRHGCMWKRKNSQSYGAISEDFAKTAYTLATSALPPPTTGQADDNIQQHTSIKPRDCLVYARCCYDFGKYTEAERVLFQTKFGDKAGFIKEAAQIYGEELSIHAFHLAASICLKTNRQSDSIEFALHAFAEDSEYLDIVTALTQNRL